MKAARPYPIVTITPKGERAIVDGHPWHGTQSVL